MPPNNPPPTLYPSLPPSPPPPTPPPMNAWVNSRYRPLDLQGALHDFLSKYDKKIPSFDNDGDQTTEEHLVKLQDYCENLGIEYDYICMRLFVKILEVEPQKRFKTFPPNSINIMDRIIELFSQ